jgi:hypothetical protein
MTTRAMSGLSLKFRSLPCHDGGDMKGLIDRKGEQFAYFEGVTLYTLDGEPTGRIDGQLIVDLAGNPIWRIVGDAVYALDGSETIGFIGSELSDQYQY